MDPKFSVVIPVYNAEKYLRQCLDSICGQTLKEIEIICVDDGSGDASPEILRAYQEKDSRIRIFHQQNLYAGVARNNGLSHARGEYVIFLDSDDFSEPVLLERAYQKGKEKDADIVLFSGRCYHEQTGQYTPMTWLLDEKLIPAADPFSRKDAPRTILSLTKPEPWSKAFKRSFVEKEGLAFQPLQNSNDAYFTIVAMCVAEKITYVKEELVNYRIEQESNLQSKKSRYPLCFIQAFEAIYDELNRRNLYPELEYAYLNTFLGNCEFNLRTVKGRETKWKICEAIEADSQKRTHLLEKPDDYFARPRLARSVKGMIRAWEWSCRRENRVFTEEAEVLCPGCVENPKVSVIIPVYNVQQYLRECLDSVCGQTLKEIEIICINDGSPDGSLEILKEYAGKDPRITVLTQHNQGLSASRNHGAKRAKGEYLYYLDSDDALEPDALRLLYETAQDRQLDVLFFDARDFCAPGEEKENEQELQKQYFTRYRDYSETVTGRKLMTDMLLNGDYRHPACLQFIRRSFYEENGLSFWNGQIYEDVLFTAKCMMRAKRACHIRETLYLRRLHGASITHGKPSFDNVYSYFQILDSLQKLYYTGDWTEEEKEALSIMVSGIFYWVQQVYHKLDEYDKWCVEALDPCEKRLLTGYVRRWDDAMTAKEKQMENVEKIRKSKAYKIGNILSNPSEWLRWKWRELIK